MGGAAYVFRLGLGTCLGFDWSWLGMDLGFAWLGFIGIDDDGDSNVGVDNQWWQCGDGGGCDGVGGGCGGVDGGDIDGGDNDDVNGGVVVAVATVIVTVVVVMMVAVITT